MASMPLDSLLRVCHIPAIMFSRRNQFSHNLAASKRAERQRTRFSAVLVTIKAAMLAALFSAGAFSLEAVHARDALQVRVALSNSAPVVFWSNPVAQLQIAPSVAGGWSPVSNAVSPYTVPATNVAAFFRLLLECTPPPSGLVSWWTGDGTAADLIGTNHGILNGGVVFASGQVRQAFRFDGTTGWVEVPPSDSFNPTGPFSVECWINGSPSQASPQSLIVDKSHGFVDGTGWALQTAPSGAGNAQFFYGLGSVPTPFPVVTTASSVLDDQWHHLAGVWTGAQLQLYQDGVLQDTLNQTTLPANNSRQVEIGRSWGGGTPTRFFRGLIDEVTYYNRSLSSNDVAAIFGAGPAGKCKP
jgi:hypothetical protein